MINTIFYFADTENEYLEKYNKGEVSSRTISFIKDSNKIFIDGHDYIDRQSVIDQLVADSQQKDQALANLLRQELAAAEQELQSSISDANDYAEGVHNDLQGFKTEIAQDLTDSITAAITNANGRTIWTELSTTNEGLTAATNRINVALDADGNVKYTSALQSVINTGIDNNQAFTNIANRYAVLNDNQEIISWMTSGFKGHTDGKESFAAMYAAAQEATQNAIAQVQTDVTTDAAGKYVAKAGLATEVQNIVDEAVRTNSLSYVASKSDVSGAESRMGAQYTTLNNALGTTNTTLSEVKTTADEGKARASLLTSAGQSGGYIINETALESSMVSIFNKSGDASTFIQQKANAAKEGAEATAQTLINTAVSNAAATYATQVSLDNVESTLSSYLKDSNGNVITSASLRESVDANSASITALANNLETGTAAGLVSKAGLDEAVNGLLAQNSSANTKSTIQQIANNAAASTDITTRMQDAFGVDALNKIAQKSYVDGGITTATTNILSEVDSRISTAKAGLATETYANEAAATAASTLKSEIWDSDNGKPLGIASLEQSVTTATSTANTAKSTADTAKSTADTATTAITNLQTSVDNSIASLTQTVNSNSTAITDLQTAVKDGSGNLISSADLKQSVDTTSSNLTALTEVVNGLSGDINTSGIITESTLDGAVAALFAQQNSSTKGTVESSITASVNDGLSNITLSADKIDFTTTSASFSGAVQAVDITAKNIRTKDGSNNITNSINSDGSGMLASGGMQWTTNGGLTLSQTFLQSLFEALGTGAVNNSTYKGYTGCIVLPNSNTFKGDLTFVPKIVETTSNSNGLISGDVDANELQYTIVDGKTVLTVRQNWSKIDLSKNEATICYNGTKYSGQFVDADLSNVSRGDIILYFDGVSTSNQYPINGTLAQKKSWLFDRVYCQGLVLDRGIVVAKERADIANGINESALTANNIDSHVYKFVNKNTYFNVNNIQDYASGKTLSEVINGQYEFCYGEYNSGDGEYYIWTDDQDYEEFLSNNSSLRFDANKYKSWNATKEDTQGIYGYGNIPNSGSESLTDGCWCYIEGILWRYGAYSVVINDVRRTVTTWYAFNTPYSSPGYMITKVA